MRPNLRGCFVYGPCYPHHEARMVLPEPRLKTAKRATKKGIFVTSLRPHVSSLPLPSPRFKAVSAEGYVLHADPPFSFFLLCLLAGCLMLLPDGSVEFLLPSSKRDLEHHQPLAHKIIPTGDEQRHGIRRGTRLSALFESRRSVLRK
jgi:hypothetical protein